MAEIPLIDESNLSHIQRNGNPGITMEKAQVQVQAAALGLGVGLTTNTVRPTIVIPLL